MECGPIARHSGTGREAVEGSNNLKQSPQRLRGATLHHSESRRRHHNWSAGLVACHLENTARSDKQIQQKCGLAVRQAQGQQQPHPKCHGETAKNARVANGTGKEAKSTKQMQVRAASLARPILVSIIVSSKIAPLGWLWGITVLLAAYCGHLSPWIDSAHACDVRLDPCDLLLIQPPPGSNTGSPCYAALVLLCPKKTVISTLSAES